MASVSRCSSTKDPAELDWASVGASIVVESTGLFTKGPMRASIFAER